MNMRRYIYTFFAALLIILVAGSAGAERLEAGLSLDPSWVHNDRFKEFSDNEAFIFQSGLDLRSEVGDVKGFKFLPLIGYRYERVSGTVGWFLDTELQLHDFFLGLRVRKGLLSWLAVFAEAKGGVLLASLDGWLEPQYGGYSGWDSLESRDNYTDRAVTWSAGIAAGLEAYISRSWLRSRGIRRFTFGGEMAFGYLRRGDLTIDPLLEPGGEDAIGGETLGGWGELNASVMVLHFALSFYFF